MFTEKKRSIIVLHGIFQDDFFSLLQKRKVKRVYVLEGRPFLDGAKITAQALIKHDILPVVIADHMAGFLFYQNWVKEVWASYQEIRQGHVLCKIGSLSLGVMAATYDVPMKVFPSGQRKKYIAHPKEILFFEGQRVAARGAQGFVPLLEDVSKKYLTEIYA